MCHIIMECSYQGTRVLNSVVHCNLTFLMQQYVFLWGGEHTDFIQNLDWPILAVPNNILKILRFTLLTITWEISSFLIIMKKKPLFMKRMPWSVHPKIRMPSGRCTSMVLPKGQGQVLGSCLYHCLNIIWHFPLI